MWVLSPSLAAASASMRPSWPPPNIPMLLPGGRASGIVLRSLGNAVGLGSAPGHDAGGERLIGERKNLRCQQSGIGGASFADGERPHRHAGGHLGDGQEAVQ